MMQPHTRGKQGKVYLDLHFQRDKCPSWQQAAGVVGKNGKMRAHILNLRENGLKVAPGYFYHSYRKIASLHDVIVMYRYSPADSRTGPVPEPPELRDKTTFSLYEWVMASISLFNGKLTPVFTRKVTVLHLALVHVAKCLKDGFPSARQESMSSVGVQCCLVGKYHPLRSYLLLDI